MNNISARLATAIAYATVCIIWGTTWLAIKVGLHGLPPLTAVGLRFLIAGGLLACIAAWRRQLPRLSEIPYALVGILSVFLFGLNYALVYVAETRIDSGLVAVLFGTVPLFSFAFARRILQEMTPSRVWIGAATSLGGLLYIFLTQRISAVPIFALAAIAAAASSAFANVYAKRHPSPPLYSLPPAMLIAGGTELLLGLVFEKNDWSAAASFGSLSALLYLAICGSALAFFLLLWLLNRLSAGAVAMATLTYPIIAIAAGALFAGEPVTSKELVGTALVLLGLWIAYGLSTPRIVSQKA